MPFFSSLLPGIPGQGFNENAFQQWLKDWRDRGAGNDQGVDYRHAFANGIEPDLDPESQTWKWPNQLAGGPSTPAPADVLAAGLTRNPSPPGPPVDDPAAPAPTGLLDRIAAKMGDAGYGGGEDAKRTALRRALGAMGSRMVAGSMKEGFGALAPAVSAGYSAYSGDLAGQKEQRDQDAKDAAAAAVAAQKEGVQERYTRALTAQAESGITSKADAVAAAKQKVAARAALIAGRRDAVGKLSPDVQKRLAPLIGADDFDKFYFDATGIEAPAKNDIRNVGGDLVQVNPDSTTKVLYRSPVAPASGGGGEGKAPTTRNMADGTTAQWNPGTNSWETIATKTGKDSQQEEAQRLYREALKDPTHALAARVLGKDNVSRTDPKQTWQNAWEAAGITLPPPDFSDVSTGSSTAKRGAAPPPPANADPTDVTVARQMATDPQLLVKASGFTGVKLKGKKEAISKMFAAKGKSPTEIAAILAAAGIQ